MYMIGLGTIYLINAVLAGISIFKAQERDQPPALWAAKTFSVGGLAFDQLTQLKNLTRWTLRYLQKVCLLETQPQINV